MDIRCLCGRKTDDGELLGKREKWQNRQDLWRNGRIIVSVISRGLPSASVDIRGLRGGKMEDVELLGRRGDEWLKRKKLGMDIRIIADARFRGLP